MLHKSWTPAVPRASFATSCGWLAKAKEKAEAGNSNGMVKATLRNGTRKDKQKAKAKASNHHLNNKTTTTHHNNNNNHGEEKDMMIG